MRHFARQTVPSSPTRSLEGARRHICIQPGADILAKTPEIVDFIVLPDTFGYFAVNTLDVCGVQAAGEISNGYIGYTARGLSLAILFVILNSLAATRRFSGSNCIRYLSGDWGGPR